MSGRLRAVKRVCVAFILFGFAMTIASGYAHQNALFGGIGLAAAIAGYAYFGGFLAGIESAARGESQ